MNIQTVKNNNSIRVKYDIDFTDEKEVKKIITTFSKVVGGLGYKISDPQYLRVVNGSISIHKKDFAICYINTSDATLIMDGGFIKNRPEMGCVTVVNSEKQENKINTLRGGLETHVIIMKLDVQE